jgi:hypothetical protein
MNGNQLFKRFLIASTILWALSALRPAAAFAQGRTWAGESLAQMVETARWKLGLLRVNGCLDIANAGYDADIYYGYLDEAVPDFTLSAGLPVQLLVPLSEKVVVDLYDFPQYLFFLDTKKERAWNNRFRGQTHLALERVYLQAGGGLSDVRNRLSPELDVPVRERTNRLDGLVLWQASRTTSLAAIYGTADHDFGDASFEGTDIARALNRKESFFDLTAYVQPRSRVRFFLDGQYGIYDFIDDGEEVSRDAHSYGVLGGFDIIPRQGELVESLGIEGSLSLGYMKFDMKDPRFIDGSGLTGAVDLSVEIRRRTSVRTHFARGYQFSVYAGASFFVTTVYGGGLTRQLSRRAFIRYDLSFGRISYPASALGGEVPEGFFSRYTTHTVSAEVRLSRDLAMTFFATLGKRKLENSDLTGDRNFFGINLIYGRAPARISAPARGMAR